MPERRPTVVEYEEAPLPPRPLTIPGKICVALLVICIAFFSALILFLMGLLGMPFLEKHLL